MVFKRPGVYVQENLLLNEPAVFPAVSLVAVIGTANRGPTTPTLVESWTQFVSRFGGFENPDSKLAHAMFAFFNNGGSYARVIRTVGTGAAPASRTLNDAQSTPEPILQVTATNPGAWGNSLTIEISAGVSAGRFNLTIFDRGEQRERWVDLTLLNTDARYAPLILDSPTSGSLLIKITDLLDRVTDPYDPGLHFPAVSTAPGGDALTAGVNGAAPTQTQIVDAVKSLDVIEEFMTINIPGVTDSVVINPVIAYCEARQNVFLVIDCAPNLSASGSGSAVEQLESYNRTSYAAMYYPQIVVSDPSNTTQGTTRKIAPGGAVLGQYMATDAARGVYKAPAGIGARLAGVVALEKRLSERELDDLNVAGVNALKTISGVGFCIFGARTLKLTQIDRYVNVRRNLIAIRDALISITRFAVFENNNPILWHQVTEICNRQLTSLWKEGGLRGNSAEEAFYVKCDEENNPANKVFNGELNIEVGVALQVPAEFVVIRIGQFEGGVTALENVNGGAA